MLVQKIRKICPDLTSKDFGPRGTIRVEDDGSGPRIVKWEHPTIEQPTQEQLDGITIDPDAPPVPASITPRQCRLILEAQGLLDAVEDIIQRQDRATRIAWEYASEFRRNDPLLLALAQTLGLKSAQIDQFFIAAAKL